jgi:hypothetical protein
MRRIGLLLAMAAATSLLDVHCAVARGGDGTRLRPFVMHVASPIHAADGWSVRVNSVTFNAKAALAAASPLNKPPRAGHQYVLVEMTVTFVGNRPTRTIDGLVFYAIGRSNKVYDFQLDRCGLAPRQLNDFKPLAHGRSAAGALCVDVRKSDLAGLILIVEPAQLLPGRAQTYFRLR